MQEPPLVLVKTWYELLIQTECKEAQSHSEDMLLGSFGSEQAVVDYLKNQNLID
jgi:hypothetical protein